MTNIKHVFVLMMENRSFDHLLGLAGVSGVQPPDAIWGMIPGAPDRNPLDPPHEFADVRSQMAGTPPNSGFRLQSYANVSMQGFGPGTLPVLTRLASEYLLFDNWFSAMPGPTWPNRFFVHAASSGGLDNSPSDTQTIESETIDSLSFTFQYGTLFERLENAGKQWRVYHADAFPQVLAIKGMIDPFRLNTAHFSWIGAATSGTFAKDLEHDYDVDYTFIEPDYGLLSGGLADGNSQHPTGSVAAGEAFIKFIYEAIRNSAVWNNSLLFVTYDEHGGFFDHLYPPAATPPADDDRNRNRASCPEQFAFNQFGLRVPTIAISPWIRRGSLGTVRFPGCSFDHTTIISTVREIFGQPGAPLPALTQRDRAMRSIAAACDLPAPRGPQDTPASLDGAAMAASAQLVSEDVGSAAAAAPDKLLHGFTRIAMSLDLAMAQAGNIEPIAKSRPELGLAIPAPTPFTPSARLPERTEQRLHYIQAVAERHRAASITQPNAARKP